MLKNNQNYNCDHFLTAILTIYTILATIANVVRIKILDEITILVTIMSITSEFQQQS